MNDSNSPNQKTVIEDSLDTIKEYQKEEKREGSRLALLLFAATLLGSLLGAVADLNEAKDLVHPLLRLAYPAPTLNIIGSETLLDSDIGIAEQWEQAFSEVAHSLTNLPLLGRFRRNPELQFNAIDSLDGVRLIKEGASPILISTEPLSGSDLEELGNQHIIVQCAAEIGYDVITFVTHLNNLDPPMSIQDLTDVLTGKTTDWVQLGKDAQPINIIADVENSTTQLALKRFTESTSLVPNFTACHSNGECLDLALSTPGSLYWVSASWLQDQPHEYLNAIQIKNQGHPAQEPLQADFNPDWYPKELIRPIYIYSFRSDAIPESTSDLAAHFVGLVRGVQGQEILGKHNFYTFFDPPVHITPELPEGFGVRADDVPVVCR